MPPIPLLPGFNPDPSIVRTADGYLLVTSTFEYLPGIPVYRSDDLERWELLGHVATRPGQLGIDAAPTGTGVYAPTIRSHDDRYHVIVTAVAGRGNVVFTADDPAGPWSDGTTIDIAGIDPDLAWDDDGTCLVTWSGFEAGAGGRGHLGILQARVDLATGAVLEPPRSLWSGTGGQFPEAPHLYRIGAWWYLVIAEGGTERGHAISVARSTAPTGPFEGCPGNPVLTARGTTRRVQCTGHGDLFQTVDGDWKIVHLGTWADGLGYRFAPLGRETYLTDVTWRDDWPVVAPLVAEERSPLPPWVDDFDGDGLGGEWVSMRRLPTSFARVESNALVRDGEGRSMDDRLTSTFVGRRLTRVYGRVAIVVRRGAADTVGGLCLRYDEHHHCELEAQAGRVVARLTLPTIVQEHEILVDAGTDEVTLALEIRPSHPRSPSADTIDLVVELDGDRHHVASFDGRYLSVEMTSSFTGRVVGPYCRAGRLLVERFEESDVAPDARDVRGSRT